MRQTVDAVYENGVFKPLNPPELPEGQHVRLEIETTPEEGPDDMLELAARVYQGLSDQQVNEIEKIALDRGDFFGNGTR